MITRRRLAKQLNAPIIINLVHYSLPYFVDGPRRSIYSGVDESAAIELIATHEQVHAALLAPR